MRLAQNKQNRSFNNNLQAKDDGGKKLYPKYDLDQPLTGYGIAQV